MFENANRIGINGYLVDSDSARSLPHNLNLGSIANQYSHKGSRYYQRWYKFLFV